MKFRSFTYLALLVTMSASCNDQNDPEIGRAQDGIIFVSGLNDTSTRISQDGSEWTAGDQVGIYMLKTDGGTATDFSNVLYKAESSAPSTAFEIAEGSASISYPTDESPVEFIAYYPYNSAVAGSVYPINLADQSASMVAHDLMYATADNKGNGYVSGPVTFKFAHQLSRIVLSFIDENDGAITPDAGKVTIKGMNTVSSFNLSTGTLGVKTEKAAITPYNNNNSFEAILLPFNLVAGHEIAVTIGGKEYVWEMNESYSGLEVKPGYSYTFKVSVNATTSEVEGTLFDFNGNSVAPWGNNGGGSDPMDLGLPAWEDDGLVRAFPGAEGGGMFTTGGRGGRVIKVTNLNDSGTGSLRAAVEASGARTVVFEVDGIIELTKRLNITNGDLTIAGQTAPGDGICIKNYPVVVSADNIIIRYIRCRMGDEVNAEADALEGRWHKNIIIDHCSMSWSTDECSSFYANENFTMQWCVLAESLRNSKHDKGTHGYGAIWGGVNASYHHNLLAHHDSRNPRFDGGDVYGIDNNPLLNSQRAVDYRNCVVYNFSNQPAYGGEAQSINYVGNYYKWGPGSIEGPGVSYKNGVQYPNSKKKRQYFYYVQGVKEGVDYGCPSIYQDNTNVLYPDNSGVNADNWAGFPYDNDNKGDTEMTKLTAPVPIKPNGVSAKVTYHSALDAYERVLDFVGASLKRDAVDARVVNETRTGTAGCMVASNGSINGYIDSQQDVGGWPTYAQGAVKTDTDGDGIPDEWEEMFGLDKNSAADGNTKTLDPTGRYTNLEVYLHYLVKDIVKGQVEGGNYITQ